MEKLAGSEVQAVADGGQVADREIRAGAVARARSLHRRMQAGRFTRHLPALISFAIGLGIWQIVGTLSSDFVFASFSDTMAALWRLTTDGTMLHNARISLIELGVGFSFAAVVGILGGLAAGLWRTFREMTDNWVIIALAIPFAALFPIFLVWFGLGMSSKIALAAFAGFQPIWLNTKAGVSTVDRNLIEMTTVFGGGTLRRVRSVVFPWCLPSMVEGLRIGLGRAFLGVIIGELLASEAGLGYLIGLSGQTLRMSDLLATVVVVAGITLILSTAMSMVQHWLVPWWKERG